MADVEMVQTSFNLFKKNKDNFIEDYTTFSKTLKSYEKVRRATDKIYVFATLQAHTDTENTDFSDLEDIAATLDTDLSEATSYFMPMIANMDTTILNEYMANDEMAPFIAFVNDIIKDKPYILSVESEELLAQAQVLFETPEAIYDTYLNQISIYSGRVRATTN
jgi:oligoendopeptidase F